ncbi:MAG: sugar transferase [Caldilineaceae bacterium]
MQSTTTYHHSSLQWIDAPKRIIAKTNSSAFHQTCIRALDLTVTILGLLVLWPLFPVLALLIKLDSPGPVFFVQERVGSRLRIENGRPVWEIQNFKMYKFRSMRNKADQTLHQEHIKAFARGELSTNGKDANPFKLANDPRITKVGAILRKTSLDELPQLINVLKGEMSLVGPRPVPAYEVAEYQEHHFERLAARPGLTGLWQLNGRSRVSFEEMIQMDIDYVRKQSVWQYLRILILTIPSVLLGSGAQ